MIDNELIAEFMGRKYPDGDVHTHYTFKYDTSWDWLMPVVEKIEDLTSTNKETGNLLSSWTYYYKIFNGTINTDIRVAYSVVVEFIKWYNASPKQ